MSLTFRIHKNQNEAFVASMSASYMPAMINAGLGLSQGASRDEVRGAAMALMGMHPGLVDSLEKPHQDTLGIFARGLNLNRKNLRVALGALVAAKRTLSPQVAGLRPIPPQKVDPSISVQPIRRIFVPNRGEAASRLITAAKELSLERGEKIEVVVPYQDLDKGAPFVTDADIAVHIPTSWQKDVPDLDEHGVQKTDEKTGAPKTKKLIPYLDLDLMLRLVQEYHCDAVWPGWGFLSETAELSAGVASSGARFIGPGPEAIRIVGDKIGFKKLSDPENQGWSGGPVNMLDEARGHAERLGYPVVVKATAGGGGKGIRFVETPEALETAFNEARDEARLAFGDPTVYIEKAILPGPGRRVRHIEVQVIADAHGNVVVVGDRDCSLQLANQKIVEIAPAPGLSDKFRAAIHARAVQIVKESGYVGAATVEGLTVDEGEAFYPMELNARLQVEHTITEVVAGVDLVREQIRVAEGHPLSVLSTPEPRGSAIEVRLNAEDPDGVFDPKKGFPPTGGTLDVYRPPTGPGIRTDTGVREGTVIPIGYDKMVAKVIVSGRNLPEAIARTRRALGDFVMDGLISNRGFAMEVLEHADFKEGRYTTKWLERGYVPNRKAWEVKKFSQEALVATAVLAHRTQQEAYQRQLLDTLKKGRLPSLPPRKENTFHFELFEHDYPVTVRECERNRYVVHAEGRVLNVTLEDQGKSGYDFFIDGRKIKVTGSEKKGQYELSVDAVPFSVGQPAVGEIRPKTNGTVDAIHVRVDDMVAKGADGVTLEVMKLKDMLRVPLGGRVVEVLVRKGEAVKEGQLLVRIDTNVGDRKPPEAPRIQVQAKEESGVLPLATMDEESARQRVAKLKEEMGRHFSEMSRLVQQALFGFDPLDLFYHEVTKGWERVRELSPFSQRFFDVLDAATKGSISQEALMEAASRMVNSYVDIEMLFQRDGFRRSLESPSMSDQFYEFLRKRESASPDFQARLLQALSHFGIKTLTPSPELDHALTRILVAHEELEVRQQVLLRVFRWLRTVREKGGYVSDPRLSEALETSNDLDRDFSKVIHAAMGVHFEYTESQLGRITREEAMSRVTRSMAVAKAHPKGSTERNQVIRLMANQPDATGIGLVSFLTSEDPVEVDIASQAFFRRLYEDRHVIGEHRLIQNRHRPLGVGSFRDGESDVERVVVGAYGRPEPLNETDLRELIGRGVEQLTSQMSSQITYDNNLEIVIPALAPHLRDFDSLAKVMPDLIGYVSPGLNIKRITLNIVSGNNIDYLTFRPVEASGRFAEDPLFRFIHPYRAQYMELWRLRRHWNVTKITTPWQWNHLFYLEEKEAAGKDPKKVDRRLFAYSIVPHLSQPKRDDQGRLSFREIDLAFGQAIHSIREAKQGAGKSANTHRVNLIIRPELTATREDIEKAIARLAPRVRGIGVEETNIKLMNWREKEGDPYRHVILRARNPGSTGIKVEIIDPVVGVAGEVKPKTAYDLRVMRNQSRGLVEPYQYIKDLVADQGHGAGTFQELDIRDERLVIGEDGTARADYTLDEVSRDFGNNKAKIIFSVVTRKTKNHPEGIKVMQIVNDPTIALCPLEGPECARVIAAIDYAERHGLEVDWKATSSGAGISMTKGTENLDWTALVMRRIGEFTDAGGVINIIVDGDNIGAQSYWDANATMKIQRKGLLIKTPRSYTALTGNNAQRISGSVAAEDSMGLAGALRITGPNGETQFLAGNIPHATELLWEHHDLVWRASGEIQPDVRKTTDPFNRDVTEHLSYQETATAPWNIGLLLDRGREREEFFPMERVIEGLNLPSPSKGEKEEGLVIRVREGLVEGVPTLRVDVMGTMPVKGEEPDYHQIWQKKFLEDKAAKISEALRGVKERCHVIITVHLEGFDGDPTSLFSQPLSFGGDLEGAFGDFNGKITLLTLTRNREGGYVAFSKVFHEDRAVKLEKLHERATSPVYPVPMPGVLSRLNGGELDEHRTVAGLHYDHIYTVDKGWNVGAILGDKEKKTPFPVKALMEAIRDQDGPDLPARWNLWKRGGADLVEVEETTVGGIPTTMIGIEARPIPRERDIPPGYPGVWSGSTLFPEGSKKVARAIHAASGRTDAVVVANLSGFDGSPESLFNNQLEWGTEIAEAVRKFQGRLVFIVTTRYHGGAYVVFSRVLNPNLMVGALDGTFASVIGGAVAVKIIFPSQINEEADKRLGTPLFQTELSAAPTPELKEKIRQRVRDEVEAEFLRKYDSTHTVQRALDVGSISAIVKPKALRPWIIEQLSNGREAYRRKVEEQIDFWTWALRTFMAEKGSLGESVWEAAVRAMGLGPYLERMRGITDRKSDDSVISSPRSDENPKPSGAVDVPADDVQICHLEVDAAVAGLWGTGFQQRTIIGLPPGPIGPKALYYGQVGSTNDVVRHVVGSRYRPGYVVVANSQTSGRGRGDHTWMSKPGAGLYLTADAAVTLPDAEMYKLSFATAVAVAKAVGEMSQSIPTIKWPNDIYLGDRKLAGILIERLEDGRFAIGIGLNTNAISADFGEELASRAVSLKIDTGRTWSHDLVLKKVLSSLNQTLVALQEGRWTDIKSYVEANAYLRGRVRAQRADGSVVIGRVQGISSTGGLIIIPDGNVPPVILDEGSVEKIS